MYIYTELSIHIVLHPAYKEEYFADHEWPTKWKDEARHLIVEEWTTRYAPQLRAEDIENARDNTPLSRPTSASASSRRPGHISVHASTVEVRVFFSDYCENLASLIFSADHSRSIRVTFSTHSSLDSQRA